MDWGSVHYILKGLVALAALSFASASLIALWRLPGVFGWNRSRSGPRKKAGFVKLILLTL
jgi:hypothetical protein